MSEATLHQGATKLAESANIWKKM